MNGTDNGDVAEYHCDIGFETENQTSVVLSKCLQSGLWEKPAECKSNYTLLQCISDPLHYENALCLHNAQLSLHLSMNDP